MTALIVAALVGLSVFVAPQRAECAECGIRPIKPIVPVGCKDLVALCACDSSGNNCRWQWTCVK